MRTFYHTQRRGYVTAEVIDVGNKAPVEVTGLAVSTVQGIVQGRPFVVIGQVAGPKGPKRRIYGVMA